MGVCFYHGHVRYCIVLHTRIGQSMAERREGERSLFVIERFLSLSCLVCLQWHESSIDSDECWLPVIIHRSSLQLVDHVWLSSVKREPAHESSSNSIDDRNASPLKKTPTVLAHFSAGVVRGEHDDGFPFEYANRIRIDAARHLTKTAKHSTSVACAFSFLFSPIRLLCDANSSAPSTIIWHVRHWYGRSNSIINLSTRMEIWNPAQIIRIKRSK